MIPRELKSRVSALVRRKIYESFWFYAWGTTKRYRQSLKIHDRGDGRFNVELDYRGVDHDEPLGVWFEYGTRRHFIEPKVRHPAGGIKTGREKGETGRQTDPIDPEAPDPPLNRKSKQAPQALSWLDAGNRFFSRGHWVAGIRARYIMRSVQNDIRLNLPNLIKGEMERWQG